MILLGIKTSGTMYDSGDFDSDFSLKNTDDLSEGNTNLYYTTARARADVTLDTAYDAQTGTRNVIIDDGDLAFDIIEGSSQFIIKSDIPLFVVGGGSGPQSVTWKPLSDATEDLGEGELPRRWNNLWLSGSIKDGTSSISVANMTTNLNHTSSNGNDHSSVVLNNTHRSSNGTDHSNVVLNDTHRGSDGTNHSNVVLNDTHRGSDGTNHSNVVLNDTHRGSDGSDHSLVNALPSANILAGTFGGSTPYTFPDDLKVNGNLLTVGSGSADADIIINGSAGNNRQLKYRTAGNSRFEIGITNATESGSDVGSDYIINSMKDDGSFKATPLAIQRSTGRVGINVAPTNMLGKLHVDQSSAGASIPVLFLDQADVSEPMIKYESTIGTGNSIEAVGAKTLTVTHFIKHELPGGLIRYEQVGTIA